MSNDSKDKKIYFKILVGVIITIILVLLVGTAIFNKNKFEVELTQLKNMTSSQMMGYVIKTSDDKVIVIDGGTKGDTENLKSNIKKYTNKVDAWFVTHPHKDHNGGLSEIIKENEIKIDKIYTSLNSKQWYEKNEEKRAKEATDFIELLEKEDVKEKVEEVKLNQKIDIGKLKIEILGIKNPEFTNNAINNSSMIIKMLINNKSIIFLGDSGIEAGNKLIDNQKGKLKADIVQVAHHGQSGVNENVYKEIKPTIALWPTPEWLWNNDNGNGEDSGQWKTKETRKWLKQLGVEKNIIEKDGNITIKIY